MTDFCFKNYEQRIQKFNDIDLTSLLDRINSDKLDGLAQDIKKLSKSQFKLTLSDKYDGPVKYFQEFEFPREDMPEKIAQLAEVRKKVNIMGQDTNQVSLDELLNIAKIGMKMPQQDLDHIKDFHRVTTLVKQKVEFELQDGLVLKLRNFLLYMCLSKLDAILKPHLYAIDINQMVVKNKFTLVNTEWLNKVVYQSNMVHYPLNSQEYRFEDRFQEVLNSQYVSASNPACDMDYSIWDRVAVEEILQLREALETSQKIRNKEARNKTLLEALKNIQETLQLSNENFEELLNESPADQSQKLTRSKMELLTEAQSMALLLSNTECDDPTVFDTAAKVHANLTLAELTLDVNHILGAMIYLTQSIDADLTAQLSSENKDAAPLDDSNLNDTSAITLQDLDLQVAGQNTPPQQERKRSKSAKVVRSSRRPLLVDKVSDTLSQRYPKRSGQSQATNKRINPRKVVPASLQGLSEDEIQASLEKLGCRVNLLDFFKKKEGSDTMPRLTRETDAIKDPDQIEEVSAIQALQILAKILEKGVDIFKKAVMNKGTYSMNAEKFSLCFFSRLAVNQKRETFQMINRLTSVLLPVFAKFKKVIPKESPSCEKLKEFVDSLHTVPKAVSRVLTANLVGMRISMNGNKFDQLLKNGPSTQFSHIPGTRSSTRIFAANVCLRTILNGKINDNWFKTTMRFVCDLSKPKTITRLVERVQKNPYATKKDKDLSKNRFLHKLIVDNLDALSQKDDYSFETMKLNKELAKLFESFLAKDEPESHEKVFVQKYLNNKLMKVIQTDCLASQKKQSLELIKTFTACKPSRLSLACLYQVFLTVLIKKELIENEEILSNFQSYLRESQEIAEAKHFLQEITYMKGIMQLADLMDSNACRIDDATEELNSVQSQLMQSQLMSGGIPMHLFPFFSKKALALMVADAKKGVDNQDILEQLEKALEVGDQGEFLTEDEKLLHSIIHKGRDGGMDLACETLQAGLKKRGGPVAGYSMAGQEDGMTLTRAAFAVMIKFQDLAEDLQRMGEELLGGLEIAGADQGPERTQYLVDTLLIQPKGEDLVSCWVNATKMRRWLIQKKQSISQKHEYADEKEAAERKALEEIIEKVIKKAEFLAILQSPQADFKSQNDSQTEDGLVRRPSKMSRQFSQTVDDNTIFELKLAQSNERSKQVMEAGTTSVLACLQTPINLQQIVNYITVSTRKAIRRLSTLQLIHRNIVEATEDPSLSSNLEIYATWINYFKEEVEQIHYTDGLKGCGTLLESKLRSIYHKILHIVTVQLGQTKEPVRALKLLQAFNCKFSSSDFQFLAETIKIFPLLFLGNAEGQTEEDNLIMKCLKFHHEDEKMQELAKQLQETFQEIFCAIISRISHGDARNQMKIKEEGFTEVPALTRKISLLDIDWTEKLVVDALVAIIQVFELVIEQHAQIQEHEDQIYAKLKSKTSKQVIETLATILDQSNKEADVEKNQENGDDCEDEDEEGKDEEQNAAEEVKSENEKALEKNSDDDEAEQPPEDKEKDSDDEGDDGEGEGDDDDDDDKKSKKSSVHDFEDASQQEVMQVVKRVYNEKMAKNFTDGQLSMICLLSNIARVQELPRKILLKIASQPDQIKVLLHYFYVVGEQQQIALIYLFDSLLQNKVPMDVFNRAVETEFMEEDAGILEGSFQSSSGEFSAFLIKLIIKIKLGKMLAQHRAGQAISNRLLKLLIERVCPKDQFSAAVERAVLKLAELESAEKSIIFDILGSSFEKFCLNDEVEFHRKHDQIYTHVENIMKVTQVRKGAKDLNSKYLRVYSQTFGEEIKVRKSLVQRVFPMNAVLTDAMKDHMVGLLDNADIDWLTKAQIVKFFLKSISKDEEPRPKLIETLQKMRLELLSLPKKAKLNYIIGKTCKDDKLKENKKWVPEYLSAITLEEYIAQRLEKEAQTEQSSGKSDNGDEEVGNSDLEDVADHNDQPLSLQIDCNIDGDDKKSDGKKEEKPEGETLRYVEPLTQKTRMIKNYYRRGQLNFQQNVPYEKVDDQGGYSEASIFISDNLGSLEQYYEQELLPIEKVLLTAFVLRSADKFESLKQLIKETSAQLQKEGKLERKEQASRLFRVVEVILVRDFWCKYHTLDYDFDAFRKDETEKLQTSEPPVLKDLREVIDCLQASSSVQELAKLNDDEDYSEDGGEDYGGENDSSEGEGGEDGGKDKVKKKVLFCNWDEFHSFSKIDFQKLKKLRKDKSHIELFHEKSSNFTTSQHLNLIEDEEQAAVENCMATKILALRFIDRFLFVSDAHPEVIQAYLDQKLIKVSNYGFSMWARDEKNCDKRHLDQYLASQIDLKQIFEHPLVEDLFWQLDQHLFEMNSNLRLVTYPLVVKCDLLQRLVHRLLSFSLDQVLPFAEKAVNGLLKAVWWLSNHEAIGKKDEKGALQLRICKTLACLLDLVKKLAKSPKQMVEEGGIWERIVKLESLRVLSTQLPAKAVDIRNVFQLLLAESCYQLIMIRDSAIKEGILAADSDTCQTPLPFEELCQHLKHIKMTVTDFNLLGQVRGKVGKEETITSTLTVDKAPSKREDWLELKSTKPSDTTIEFKVEKGESKDKEDASDSEKLKCTLHLSWRGKEHEKDDYEEIVQYSFEAGETRSFQINELTAVKPDAFYFFIGSEMDSPPKLTATVKNVKAKYVAAEVGEATESRLKEQEFLMKRWLRSVNAQFRKQTNAVFKYIASKKNEADFVLGFYKKFVKMPKLAPGEFDFEGRGDPQAAMTQFVQNYLQTAQLMYDLVPLMTCLGDNPYAESFPEGVSLLENYFKMVDKTHIELIRRAILQRISEKLPRVGSTDYRSLKVRRIKASNFKLANRYEGPGEYMTMFSQIQRQFKSYEKWKKQSPSLRPFYVKFINEGSIDAGGPMRDAISNMCIEIMSDALPLLAPTSNNRAQCEPSMHCFQLNYNSKQPYMLQKFTFLGYFLGWSLRNMAGLAIDLPVAFWKRICRGSKHYKYTLDDLREMDSHRADFLTQLVTQSKIASDEEFEAVYDGYTFEGSFSLDKDLVDIELCPGGAQIPLTKANVEEFVSLYLKKLTELEQLQFERVFCAIQDTVGERMLAFLTPKIAVTRACSKGNISEEAFKSASKICSNGNVDEDKATEWKKWFWEIFNDMSVEEKQMMIKFMSGNQRINQGTTYRIDISGTKDSFPEGHTCGNSMDIPLYSSKELMKSRMLTAFSLCGEIDGDGPPNDYGAEDPDGDDFADEDNDENGGNGDDSDRSVQSMHLQIKHFPVFVREQADGDDKDQDDKFKLDELASDDEANQVNDDGDDGQGDDELEAMNVRI